MYDTYETRHEVTFTPEDAAAAIGAAADYGWTLTSTRAVTCAQYVGGVFSGTRTGARLDFRRDLPRHSCPYETRYSEPHPECPRCNRDRFRASLDQTREVAP